MYNSPATQTGTGSRDASNTYTRVPRIGAPIGTTPSPCNGALMVAQTVLSVGPYAFMSRRPGLQCATSAAGQASPATIRPLRARSSVLRSVGNTAGGIVACVTRCVTNSSCSDSPLIESAGVRIKLAPADQAINISDTEASNARVAICLFWVFLVF